MLAILLFSLPVIAHGADTGPTCTDEIFREWTGDKGEGATSPGASVTAGIGDVPLYDAPHGKLLGQSIPFAQGYAVAEARRTPGGGMWLRLRGTEPHWLDARADGPFCGSMKPIREGKDRLALKGVAELGVDELGKRLQGYDAPRKNASRTTEISVQRHYFVFARRQGDNHPGCRALTNDPGNREWWLLGERQQPTTRNSGLIGWFPACRLIPWKSRQAVRPVSGTVFRGEKGEKIAVVRPGDLGNVNFALLGTAGPDYQVAFYGAGDGGVSYREEAAVGRATAEVYPRYENPSVVFLVDGTASTQPHLKYMEAALRTIQGGLRRQYGNRIRYALAAYRDRQHGIRRHFQIYSGLTGDLESLLNAKLPTLQSDIRKDIRQYGDDFKEDLFYGLVRVLEDLLPRSERERMLPIIVVLGDMGSHERSVNFDELTNKRDETVHLIFFQTPSDRDSWPTHKREAYDEAYQSFERQANRLKKEGIFTILGPYVDLQPGEITQAITDDLRDIARTGEELPRVSQAIAAGAAVEDALSRFGWPVEWRPGLIAALERAGFPTKYIEQRRFQLVIPARVSQGQVEVRVMTDKDDLRRWTTALEALAANPELWDADRLARELGDALEKVAGERPDWNEQLDVFLSRTLDLPVETEFLKHSLAEIEGMKPQELTRQFEYLNHVAERFRMIMDGVIRESHEEVDAVTGEVRWKFEDREKLYAPWQPAGGRRWVAYLPLRYLP